MIDGDELRELHRQMIEWRRDLHAHPELAFQEHRTAGFVARKLAEFGVEVREGLAGTGVVGTLKGRRDGGRSIGLRADMDALPLQELNTFEHASKYPGRMHACGHDGHTAMLLGGAYLLARSRNFSGTVHFIFQPAEEDGGGAQAMIEAGLLDTFAIDEVYGLHNMPGLPTGTFAGRDGVTMAANDDFEIMVRGAGGHAALPHKAADPLLAAAHMITALQSIVSRNTDPLDSLVVSVTAVQAGSASNVIPSEALLRGTVRSFSTTTRTLAEQRIRSIVSAVAQAFDTTAEVRYQRGYPATVNHPEPLAKALAAATDVVGEQLVIRDLAPVAGSEDFAFMLEARPGAFLFLGAGSEADRSAIHRGTYDFNDDLLPIGARYWAKLAERVLSDTGP